jgi:hypothetical protein
MNKRCKQYRNDADERQPCKQCVTRRKDFCAIRRQRIDWSHSCKDHRGIQQRIDPAQAGNVMIAENAASKSKRQNSKPCQPVLRNALEEFGRTERRLFRCSYICNGLANSRNNHLFATSLVTRSIMSVFRTEYQVLRISAPSAGYLALRRSRFSDNDLALASAVDTAAATTLR